MSYKDSGVDVEGGNKFVKAISPIVKSTFSDKVITDIGGFGALFSGAFPECKDPVLVSGTDGVGTKIKIAQAMNIHDTIGIDAVAMCVNDIIVSGARPLFFLDYIACGKLKEDVLVNVVKGIAEGCKMSRCSLIGGETAEHPNVMSDDDYDIAGFSVGVVDREKIINGKEIKTGDIVIGLQSSGIHSNGFSLVRKLFFEIKKYSYDTKLNDLPDILGKVLLAPTNIYVESLLKCIDSGITLKGLIHITGGGFYENIPRILPDNLAVKINRSSFDVPVIFNIIQKEGNVTDTEMFTTFNMGIGMMVIASKDDADKILKITGESSSVIGEVVDYKDDKVLLV
ncbi:phosphoribosylformylglycinamidine cyclo-ligase [Spirochaetota bacterium]